MIAYFLTDTLNWQVLLGKEKYLLKPIFSIHTRVKSAASVKLHINYFFM